MPGITKQLGTFMFFDVSRNVLTPRLPSSPSFLQNERGESRTLRDISSDLFTSSYVDTSNTYIFVKTKNDQGSINTIRNSLRTSTTTYTTDNTQGKVGDWRITSSSAVNYPLNTNSWYSLKTDLSKNYYYFAVNPGVNYDRDKNSADTAIQLEYFVDPEVVSVRNDVSNSVVVFPDSSVPSGFTKNTATANIVNITQQPDTLNSQNRFLDGSLQSVIPTGPLLLHDMSNTIINSRIIYKGYPVILKNTLIPDNSGYVFDTDDLIRWFNPSISKEYDVATIPYEYGWAIRITRSSTSSDVVGTWGWQASSDGGTTWKTLMTTTSNSDTYFFKNKVPGTTNTKYKL
jgi:hypothetical protein